MDALLAQREGTSFDALVKLAKPEIHAFLVKHPGFQPTRKILRNIPHHNEPAILQALHELYLQRQIDYTRGRGFFYGRSNRGPRNV